MLVLSTVPAGINVTIIFLNLEVNKYYCFLSVGLYNLFLKEAVKNEKYLE
jgi:hypothetical protein